MGMLVFSELMVGLAKCLMGLRVDARDECMQFVNLLFFLLLSPK
jgi:hypothetical protein